MRDETQHKLRMVGLHYRLTQPTELHFPQAKLHYNGKIIARYVIQPQGELVSSAFPDLPVSLEKLF